MIRLWIVLFTLILTEAAPAQDFIEIDPGLRAGAEKVWNQSGFSDTKISVIAPSTSFATRSPLTLVLFAESKWTPELILQELRDTERIYAQCGVSFRPITLIETSSKPAKKWWSDFNAKADAKIFNSRVMTASPTILYRWAGGSYSWPRYYLESDIEGGPAAYPQLLDNAVVSFKGYQDNKNSAYIPADYSVTAHELAHILLNSPHNFIYGDLLCGGPTCKGTHLAPESCEKIRARLQDR